jgi:hypothetical protein
MSAGSEAMRDVHEKLRWAEKHLADLMTLGAEYLHAGGGDERPLGIRFDNRHPPLVVVKFIVDKPMPTDISLHASDLVHKHAHRS